MMHTISEKLINSSKSDVREVETGLHTVVSPEGEIWTLFDPLDRRGGSHQQHGCCSGGHAYIYAIYML